MPLQATEFVYMLLIDLCFLGGLLVLMMIFGMRRQAAFAVMKRNFVGYFSNPTGYVFLCIFVLLTSFAAFWPHEFFTTNLANFDQLNQFLPFIMLVFIPAITMSIWAEERRQGTDELLLTLPAKDFDIVIGKYFAAVLVFTVSLLFSQLSNYGVLLAMTGGTLDTLLLFSTYLGYWFMGIAMLALGMVASFLTNNLTVGFIFGAAINAPLAFFSNADVILSNTKWVQRLYDWSLLQRFEPFGRGLISLPSATYFLGLVVIGVYLSLVLIGRRHWLGGRDGTSMLWHYMLRAVFLIVMVIAGVLIVQYSPANRARIDISAEKVSTLSDSTIAVLTDLAQEAETKPPIRIDAYISNNVPTEYVQTKYDLVNLLREFNVLGGNRIQVNLNQGIEPFSEEAILAEKRFGIRPERVVSQSRGAIRDEQIILGAAFTNGLERVVLDFIDYGMPVEYELMRSIATVAKTERKTIGIVQTDALATGAVLNIQGQTSQVPRLQIVTELEKQYEVETFSAAQPIDLWLKDENDKPTKRRYDVILVVQPSKMSPDELQNLIRAIQEGQPTAIFEDPFPSPNNYPQVNGQLYVAGTFYPRFISRPTREQANIQDLWDALDLQVDRDRITEGTTSSYWPYICWQSESENPYLRDESLNTPEILVIRETNPQLDPRFGLHPVTTGIDELCFQYVGYIDQIPNSTLTFEPLVQTGRAGRIRLSDFLQASSETARNARRGAANQSYFLAAHIKGAAPVEEVPADAGDIKLTKQHTNVIYVADIDTLSNFFVRLRNRPIVNGISYRFQNMAFVLNIIDELAGDRSYLDLRNRKIRHVTLRVVEQTTEEAMQELYDATQDFEIDMDVAKREITEQVQKKLGPLEEDLRLMDEKRKKGEPIDLQAYEIKKGWLEQRYREQVQNAQRKNEELENERKERLRAIQLDAELKVQKIQRQFKLAAVLIPPIPPLLVGLIVFTRRRLREREGISKARRLK